MSQAQSPSTGRKYGRARVLAVWGQPRSTFYARQRRARQPAVPRRRGPKTNYTDAELLDKIRAILAASPFHGEGHRKIWARLRFQQVRPSKPRVLRLMRENQLLAPQRQLAPVAEKSHPGSIVTSAPNRMWGTDATATVTLTDGQVTVFAAIDHCTAECVGIHAVKRGTRFEALEPLRQGVREHFGAFGPQAAAGLRIRHDHGSQYMSDHFQQELRFLGMESSPAFVREPQGNGCIGRFFRTLKRATALGAALPRPRRTRSRAARLRRSLQPRVVDRTAPLPVPAAGSRALPCAPARCMIMLNLLSKKSRAEQVVTQGLKSTDRIVVDGVMLLAAR